MNAQGIVLNTVATKKTSSICHFKGYPTKNAFLNNVYFLHIVCDAKPLWYQELKNYKLTLSPKSKWLTDESDDAVDIIIVTLYSSVVLNHKTITL